MRLLSKITFICNCCFIVAVLLLYIGSNDIVKGTNREALILDPLQSTIAVLGYGAIVLNIAFALALIYLWIRRQPRELSLWLILVNLLFIPVQVIYFFIK